MKDNIAFPVTLEFEFYCQTILKNDIYLILENPNSYSIFINNTNVNNVSHIRSYITKNINNNIYHRNNNKLSRSQSLPDLHEYRCRDNISSHSNISNIRSPPQYYKNSIMYHKYSPYRGDYGNSRYGDYTYNYYLNSPMRGDVSEDWKFPPQYYYMPKFNSHNYTYDNY